MTEAVKFTLMYTLFQIFLKREYPDKENTIDFAISKIPEFNSFHPLVLKAKSDLKGGV